MSLDPIDIPFLGLSLHLVSGVPTAKASASHVTAAEPVPKPPTKGRLRLRGSIALALDPGRSELPAGHAMPSNRDIKVLAMGASV